MSDASASTEHSIGTITVDDKKYAVSVRIGYDGIEYIGRLVFTDTSKPESSYQDHGAIPGVSLQDALLKAGGLSAADLEHRCYRALSERRRFSKLRQATDEMIDKIKYLNRVVVGLERGSLERDAGNQEIEEIQNQLLAIVAQFRQHAGVEDE
ncbi:MAG: hypothetical protein ABR585_09480 [Gemmatimonadaceae bacterium]